MSVTDLYRRERPGLLRLAVLLVGDAALAEDLVQETYLRAWR
ncbi:sigma factor, partial [Kibdelosporangium lantanae]